MEKLLFATGNAGKVEEMRPLFEERGFRLEQVKVDIDEIDALDVEDVAYQKVKDSFEAVEANNPIIVEDTGFFVEALGGFPGAKAAFFDGTVGSDGILALMEGEDDRSAYFKTAIAFYSGNEVRTFSGKLQGKVPREKRGEGHPHLPYDSFFVPEGGEKSFAENPELKEKFSHRKESTEKFLEWLVTR